MGDIRFEHPYRHIVGRRDRASAIREMTDEDVIAAISAASAESDPYLANVLVTEAQNRARKKTFILDTAAEGMLMIDPDGRVTFANPSAHRLLGWHAGGLVGVDVERALYGAPGGGVDAGGLGDVPAARNVGPVRARFVRREGTSFPAVFTSAPVLRNGEFEGSVLVFDDVTALAQAWDALAASELRFRTIFESAGSALFVHDLEGRIVDANARATGLLGYSRDELLRMSVADFEASLDPTHLKEYWESLSRDNAVHIGSVGRRKDGILLPLDVLLTRFDAEGDPLILAAVREVGPPVPPLTGGRS